MKVVYGYASGFFEAEEENGRMVRVRACVEVVMVVVVGY